MQSEYYGIRLTCKMSHGVAGQVSRRVAAAQSAIANFLSMAV